MARNNLSAVLEAVHRSRGASRSTLATELDLNRSTISALVGELVQLGLVRESDAPPTNKVGRPSPWVEPALGPVVIAVNPELDAVTIGVVGLGARVDHRLRVEVDHPITPEETVAIVVEALADLAVELVDRRVIAIAVAVPGLVRAADGIVRWAPHLDWVDAPIAQLLHEATGIPAIVGNDATLGALAEHIFGAGRSVSDLVYLNGGASGIGGGVIAGGRTLAGVGGYAGEFGQNRPGMGEPRDRVSRDGTLEDEVSRSRLLAAVGLERADEAVLAQELLTSNSPIVHSELARQRRVLSVALSNAINVFNPSLVVLGGFLSTLRAADPADLDALVAGATIAASWDDTEIVNAALGENILMIGAAELAFSALIRDPGAAAGR